MPGRRSWLLFLLLAGLVLVTRAPMAPGRILTFDDVKLAYSIGHFDVGVSQPQPSGYPLFVVEMRLLHMLHISRAEHILLTLGFPASVAALALLAPALTLDIFRFCFRGWYYRGTSTVGWRAAADEMVAGINNGLDLASREAVQRTLDIDDLEQGAAPLRVNVPEGSRIVWLLNPRTKFYGLVQQAFAPSAARPLYVTDLPPGSGSRPLGEYVLTW